MLETLFLLVHSTIKFQLREKAEASFGETLEKGGRLMEYTLDGMEWTGQGEESERYTRTGVLMDFSVRRRISWIIRTGVTWIKVGLLLSSGPLSASFSVQNKGRRDSMKWYRLCCNATSKYKCRIKTARVAAAGFIDWFFNKGAMNSMKGLFFATFVLQEPEQSLPKCCHMAPRIIKLNTSPMSCEKGTNYEESHFCIDCGAITAMVSVLCSLLGK